jgi:protocatechuate 3,4-dioxygenase beta subunit
MKPTLTLCAAVLAATALAAQQSQEIRVTSTVVTPPGAPPFVGAGGAPMPIGTGVIFGQVVEGDSNRAVAGAIVSISLVGQQIRVMTDSQGRFGFRDLPAGGFRVASVRPGWVDGAYGRTRPAGPTLPLVLTDGERISGVVIPMWRYAAIAGTVIDESGDPLVNIPVRVMKKTIYGGKPRLTSIGMDSTDDRGQFRVTSLEPGEYVVLVPVQTSLGPELPILLNGEPAGRDVMIRREITAVAAAQGGGGGGMFFFNQPSGGASAGFGEDGRPLAYPTVFYPNVQASTRATLIALTSGEERVAVDFQLRGVPVSKISGTVMGPDGPGGAQLTLVPAESDENATTFETFTASADSQGRFTFQAVPPGQYTLRAARQPRPAAPVAQTIQSGGGAIMVRTMSSAGNAPLPADPTLWAEMPLAVAGRDIPEVPVTLRAGARVSGMVQLNGSAERPTGDQFGMVGIQLEPADVRPGVNNTRGRIDQTGQIQTMGVPPGKYFIRVLGSYPNWSLQSFTVNGRDATVVPIDIGANDVSGAVLTFTDRPTKLVGQVTLETGLSGVAVLVFPVDQSAWIGYGSSTRRMANTRADKDGRFEVSNLPAGDYFAIAIPDKSANDWQNPKFLESLVPDAARIRIQDAGTATVTLKVVK